jgi:PAS domain S-box-containing protein
MPWFCLNRQSRVWRLVASAFLLLCSSLVLSQGVRSQTRAKRVLIVNEAGVSYPAIDTINRGIRTELENSPYKVEFYSEYLETILFPDPIVQQEFRRSILRKYQNRTPDVIVTVGPSALRFLLGTHKVAFSGVPLIFCMPIGPVPGSPVVDSDFTGVGNDIALAATVEAAFRLQPQTEHIFVLGGQGNFDKQLQAPLRDQLKHFEKRVDIVYLTSLTMPDLLERLRHLPSRSVVLLTTIGEDAAGTHFKSNEVGPLVVSAANAPVFSLFDTYMNHGEVGGDVSSFSEQGRVAGSMARRILSGEKPQDIPRVTDVTKYMFDWQALRRWGLKEGNLPPGSIVINRQPSFWELYKRYVIAGTVVFLAQMGMILGLLWQRRRKLRAEADLRSSEEKFSKCFRQSPLVITISRTRDSRFIDVNESFERQLGWNRDEVINQTPLDVNLWLEADQRAAFTEQLSSKGRVRDLEVCLRRKDGQTLTTLVSAELIELGGETCTISIAADITERKRAEEVLSTLSRRLIEAQEKERAWIARELHDDVSQRIALLAVTLEGQLPSADTEVSRRVEETMEQLKDLANDVQALSHRLHSSKLDVLGLAVACRSFCREFSGLQSVVIEFDSKNIPRNLPKEISLCLFRVMQEALQNAVKYSGVREFRVSLKATSGGLELTIRDPGRGFDTEKKMDGHGLGLTSMRERMKLVDGVLSIKSEPGRGTTIHAHVPLTTGGAETADELRVSKAAENISL